MLCFIIIALCQTFPAPIFEKKYEVKNSRVGVGRFSSTFIALNKKKNVCCIKRKKANLFCIRVPVNTNANVRTTCPLPC